MESRQTSITPCRCHRCGWKGQEKDLDHTYKVVGCPKCGDVEPVSYCPRCGSEDIEFPEGVPA